MNLVYLAEPRFGGWVTFTAHLVAALRAVGQEPNLFKIGARLERRKRDFGYGLEYQNVPIEALLPQAQDTLIVATSPKQAHHAERLLKAGALVVIHDPAELRPDTVAALKSTKRPVVVIRKANLGMIRDLGLNPVFIPHPYQQLAKPAEKDTHAVAISRLDWDKNTHVIAEANRKLPPELAVQIWGAENTMYTHHKCDVVDPGWREHYNGRFPATPDASVQLAAKAKYVVDLSTIKGDGDGTQYTFLEAWDAGAVLVVHRKWIITGKDSVRDGQTALAVGNAEELCDVLQQPPPPSLVTCGQAELLQHAPEIVGPAYVELVRS